MTMSPEGQTLLAGWQSAARELGQVIFGAPGFSWHAARERYVDRLEALVAAPEGVRFETVDLGGVPAMLVTPDEVIDGRALLYIHGGGYVHGGARAYRSLAGHYARRLGARVYVPEALLHKCRPQLA